MILAGGKVLISPHMSLILLVLAVTAVATVFYLRLRWLRRADRVARRSVQDLPVGVEISYAEFNAMKDDMELGPIGDGLDSTGRPFYDCSLSVAGNGKTLRLHKQRCRATRHTISRSIRRLRIRHTLG